MQKLLTWTLEAIRSEECFSWMEERRFDWTPLIQNAIGQIAEGKTVLVATDEERDWFCRYVVTHINLPEHNRPLFPVFPLSDIIPIIASLKGSSDLQLAEDMLDIAFPSGYFIWYIGKSDHFLMKLAFRKNNSFLWVFDESVENGFYLRSSDRLLDMKLIQLYRLFDNTLNESLFGELHLEV